MVLATDFFGIGLKFDCNQGGATTFHFPPLYRETQNSNPVAAHQAAEHKRSEYGSSAIDFKRFFVLETFDINDGTANNRYDLQLPAINGAINLFSNFP